MGLRFPSQKDCSCFFVTTTFRDHHPYGNRPGMYEVLANSLNHYCASYGAKVVSYALMPTHLHLLLFINGEQLGSFMRDFKKFVSQKSAPELGIIVGQLWMPRYDRVAIDSEYLFRVKLDYIHNNPVKGGVAVSPEGWYWSSAADYSTERIGPVDVWKEWYW